MIRSILVHISISVLAATLLSLAVGRLTPTISAISLLLGFGAALFVFFKMRSENEPTLKIDSFFTGVVVFIVGLFIYRHMAYLFFETGRQFRTLNTNNFGDLSLHIGIIKNLSIGGKFWPDFVSLASSKLQYPFGVDLYNALWDSIGVKLQSHLFFVGTILLFCILVITQWWLGMLGIIGLFFNGGVRGFEFLTTGIASNYQADLAWKNFFLALLIPQRGFLMALPLGIYLLKKCIDRFYFNYTFVKYEKWLLGLLWGMLPIFHLHTFLIVSIFIGCMALHTRNCKKDLNILFLAVPLSLLWILPMTNFFHKASIIHFQWGWHLNNLPLYEYFILNYGPWLLLLGYSGYKILKGQFKEYTFIFLLALVFFIVFQFVMLATWDWDNVKVIIWCYLLMLFVFNQIINKSVKDFLKVPIYMILGFSGFVCVVGLSNANNKGHGIYDTREVFNAKEGLEKTPPDAVFISQPAFNHVLTYFGKKVVFGYDGHVWSHGFNVTDIKADVESVLKGEGDWRATARKVGATHIYFGEKEKQTYKTDPGIFKDLKNISSSSEVAIYELD